MEHFKVFLCVLLICSVFGFSSNSDPQTDDRNQSSLENYFTENLSSSKSDHVIKDPPAYNRGSSLKNQHTESLSSHKSDHTIKSSSPGSHIFHQSDSADIDENLHRNDLRFEKVQETKLRHHRMRDSGKHSRKQKKMDARKKVTQNDENHFENNRTKFAKKNSVLIADHDGDDWGLQDKSMNYWDSKYSEKHEDTSEKPGLRRKSVLQAWKTVLSNEIKEGLGTKPKSFENWRRRLSRDNEKRAHDKLRVYDDRRSGSNHENQKITRQNGYRIKERFLQDSERSSPYGSVETKEALKDGPEEHGSFLEGWRPTTIPENEKKVQKNSFRIRYGSPEVSQSDHKQREGYVGTKVAINDGLKKLDKVTQNSRTPSTPKHNSTEWKVDNRMEEGYLQDASFNLAPGPFKMKFLHQTDQQENVFDQKGTPWPVKREAALEGDLILGGLMMVHEREETITCGPIMPEGGIQALEVMLYTLDVLNSRPDARFTLGAHILDDCDKDTYGLEMAVDFIKGSISNIDDSELHCNKTQVRKVISGVVGAASSVTSIQVANLLRLFKIPQVSFMSTSPELSNKQRFEYFTRTIPSDHYQVKAMVEIIRKLRWNYVSVIYEESNYGIKAFEELEALLSKHNICIAVKEKLVKDSGVAEDTAYDSIVHKLQTKPRARGAIVYGSDQEVAGLMRAVRRLNATGAFSWIGSDGWSARSLVTQSNELQVEGTLSLQPQANPVLGFDTYFLNLTVENNKRNPWFVEFWEDHFQCRYPNSSWTPYNNKYSQVCGSEERLTRHNTVFENQLQFVSDAVMALAVALGDMHRTLCDGRPGLCDAMRPTQGSELLKYLRRVAFTGLSGDKFHFDENGDGPARYNIIHFKQVSPGNFQWVNVGQYINGELQLDMPAIQFKLAEPMLPESVCSLPCEVGQAKTYVEGESCCWHCLNCSQYQIRDPLDETLCKMCPYGTVPDAWHQVCLDLPEDFLRAESGWAIGAMSLSASGILVTLFVIGVFLRNNDTPVVKASGRELSYVLLTGILLCYLITFAFVLRPTDVVCGVQRFGAGFCFTVVYAALLTKTNRISRIFNAGKRTAKRPSFITPKSQLIICSVMVSVQLIINAVWMLLSPPKAIHHYPTRDDNMLICSSYVDASYMIAFGYPIVLIIVCTVYAVLTRNIPEAFNESKHIGFTMYTTCVIWLAFVPLYFGTGGHMPLRITSMAVTISLSASVTIACLFSPKLYIILIRPEQNIRQSMMPNSRHGGTMRTSSAVATVRVGAAPFAGRPQSLTTKCSSVENTTDTKEHANDLKDKSFISRSTQTLNAESHENTTQTALKEADVEQQLAAGTPPQKLTKKESTKNIDSTVSLPALNSAAPENSILHSKTYKSTGDALTKDNGSTDCGDGNVKLNSSSSSSSHKSRSRRRRGRSKDKDGDMVKNEKDVNSVPGVVTSNGPSKL